MNTPERLDQISNKLENVLDGVLSGEIGAKEGDVAARAGYGVVKAEEVKLNHRIAIADGKFKE